MHINPVLIQKIPNISPIFGKKIKGTKAVDKFEIQNPEKLYEKNIQTIMDKLTQDEVNKAYLDNFLLQYSANDKEIVKEIFVAAAPILTFGGILVDGVDLFKKNSSLENYYIQIDSNLCDFIGYMQKRHLTDSVGQPIISKTNINNIPNKLGVYYIADGIFNRDLTNKEIEILSDIERLRIVDLCAFETLPNFIDFAISDDKAKTKIDALLERIKSLKEKNPNLTTKEALDEVINFYLKRNLEKINAVREENTAKWSQEKEKRNENRKKDVQALAKNLGYMQMLRLGIDILYPPEDEEILIPPIEYKRLNSKCENYDEIDNYLSLKPHCKTTKGSMQEILSYLSTIKEKEAEKITPETLKDNFSKIYDDPKKAAFILASDEFTYYTPKKFINALKDLMKKLENELSKKGQSVNDCVFLYKKAKSDAFIGYLLEEAGLINPQQRIEVSEEIPKNKILVYVDDILGSGETVSYRLIYNLNKKNYCLHVVSCANGRLALKDKVNLIHLQDSFNGLNSKYKAIRENSYDGESFIDSCNSSEIFFFSYPDTCASIYTKFGKYFLGLNERED